MALTEYDKREWLDERAAIIEYDGGMTREEAEKLALECWENCCHVER